MPALKSPPLRILITAGPTREMLDPVRFISNVSTGHMGYSLAHVAAMKGHKVTMISGPTPLHPPLKVVFYSIVSAEELKCACERLFEECDVLVMVAAVCDFTAEKSQSHKIKRVKIKSLRLRQTPDIVAGLAKKKKNRIVIGFCLETQDWLNNAKQKIKRKSLDGIVANYYSGAHIPFGDRKINTAFLDDQGTTQHLKHKSKRVISQALMRWIESIHKKKFPKG